MEHLVQTLAVSLLSNMLHYKGGKIGSLGVCSSVVDSLEMRAVINGSKKYYIRETFC